MSSDINLLLIEDDSQDAFYIQEIIAQNEELNCQLTIASRMNEAVDLAESNTFDVMLTDLNLPDSTGLETFIELRKCYPNIPIVVLTGLDNTETGLMAVKQGAQDYLVKSDLTSNRLSRSMIYALERKKIEERLEETISLKELLLDVLTHDLKNSAHGIHGLSSLIQQRMNGDVLIENVVESSERLIKIIENTSTLVNISSGENIEKQDLRVCDLVGEIVGEFKDHAVSQDVHIDYNPNCDFIIHANPIISEVFRNFLANALKYSASGKFVGFSVKECEESTTISCDDKGTAIKEELRESIFNRRFRADHNTISGNGLGLAIVKRIAKMHDGRVWMEVNEYGGNRFSIKLPKNYCYENEKA